MSQSYRSDYEDGLKGLPSRPLINEEGRRAYEAGERARLANEDLSNRMREANSKAESYQYTQDYAKSEYSPTPITPIDGWNWIQYRRCLVLGVGPGVYLTAFTLIVLYVKGFFEKIPDDSDFALIMIILFFLFTFVWAVIVGSLMWLFHRRRPL
jgi:hypothetical protein